MEEWKRDGKKERKSNKLNWKPAERKKMERKEENLEERGRICCGKADPS
jgi:hypothetical protein